MMDRHGSMRLDLIPIKYLMSDCFKERSSERFRYESVQSVHVYLSLLVFKERKK